jgi:hypothetical protein
MLVHCIRLWLLLQGLVLDARDQNITAEAGPHSDVLLCSQNRAAPDKPAHLTIYFWALHLIVCACAVVGSESDLILGNLMAHCQDHEHQP